MLASSRGRVAVALGLGLAATGSCGDDGGDGVHDAGPVDAAAVDAAVVDAHALCPGGLTIEGRTSDLLTDDSLFEAVLVEDAVPTNRATSAPNGRVVLCVAGGGDEVTVSGGPPAAFGDDEGDTLAGYLPRTDRIAADAMAVLRQAGRAHPFALVTTDDLDDLAEGFGFGPPDEASTFVVVHVMGGDGEPLAGAQVTLDAPFDAALALGDGGAFDVGQETTGAGVVAFGGPPLAPPPAVSVTPPDGVAGPCLGPSSLAVRPAGVTGAVVVCP